MADLPDGPVQQGRGVHGQYVYWVTQTHPSDGNPFGLRLPSDFASRQDFCETIVKAHNDFFTAAGIDNAIVEAAVFKEPHASGLPHNNILLRARKQFRWKNVADSIRQTLKVNLNYAKNIKNWMDGVVYGRVASEHVGLCRDRGL